MGAPAFKIGQVSGLASPGDGTVWVVHRGERAWNPDGSVANSGAATSGTMEEEAVLAGPVVLQVSRCGGGAARGLHQGVVRQMGSWGGASGMDGLQAGCTTSGGCPVAHSTWHQGRFTHLIRPTPPCPGAPPPSLPNPLSSTKTAARCCSRGAAASL